MYISKVEENQYEKIVLGSIVFLAGILSVAIILAGSMANEWSVNGQFSSFWNISQYGLMPVMYIFIVVAVVGLVIAIWGLFDKRINDTIPVCRFKTK